MRALVVGGGFYGSSIALYLRLTRGVDEVVVVESGPDLMLRASYRNQARVHNGCHYPRSFRTAYRSGVNLPRFVQDWPSAVRTDLRSIYAVAAGSRVTARQFATFCETIGVRCTPADADTTRLFDARRVAAAFTVDEPAFDARALRELIRAQLVEAGIEVQLGTTGASVRRAGSGLRAELRSGDVDSTWHGDLVFNCTYSGLNRVDRPVRMAALKHELAEMALVEMPSALSSTAITVVDGPFFSVVPFADRGCHTLSHVRYTPHRSWLDAPDVDPYAELAAHHAPSRFEWMRRDAAKLVPALAELRHVDTLVEVKTVLQVNETNDGRPILVERSADVPGLYSILGGKIDNVYDVMRRLDDEPLGVARRSADAPV